MNTSLTALSVSLLCCSVYADTTPACTFDNCTFDRGDQMLCSCPTAYNLPAQVHLKDRDYQGFITASYLYWNAQQEGMDLATDATWAGSAATKTGVDGDLHRQGFSYNSGFKVGLGYNFEHCDNWTLRADYTRLHQSNTSSFSAPSSTTGTGALYLDNWFFQTSGSNQNLACTQLKSRWGLDLDWLDVTMSRAFYQGKQFTATPFGGIRVSWISQDLDIDVDHVFSTTLNEGTSNNRSTSWAIGPRAGVDAHFLMGAGFRLQGSFGGSLLFTGYDRVSHSETSLSSTTSPDIVYNMNSYTALRPMLEANLGLGWGTYFSRNRYHLDLSATYDFNYLWGQNMMRVLNEINTLGTCVGDLDLSLQGLTVSSAFHF